MEFNLTSPKVGVVVWIYGSILREVVDKYSRQANADRLPVF